MLLIHMLIALPTGRERIQAHPAYVGSAAGARHMVAAIDLFHGGFAFRAVFEAVLFLQLLECFELARGVVFVFGAC